MQPNSRTDYELIKKYFGEGMAKLCRKLFPTILECNGKLFELLYSKFAYSRFLYQDIVNNNKIEEFRKYIMYVNNRNDVLKEVNKSVKELMAEAGYDFYECKSEEDIQRFAKYYIDGEKLCTFLGGRLNDCYVFFAVKKDIDKIHREDFQNPDRQDEYGTSVISIQFSRGDVNSLSIKNRYNHNVDNPDATFGNNLENIIPGLTRSFEKEYNLVIDQYELQILELPCYTKGIEEDDEEVIKANNGKFYKYNYEINNIYYCPNNVIIKNGKVTKYDKSRYLLIDYFLVDTKDKKIVKIDSLLDDSFSDQLTNFDKIEIVNDNKNKIIRLVKKDMEDVLIKVDEYGRIIEYINNNLIKVGNHFLAANRVLRKIECNILEKVGNYFLDDNNGLERISFPNMLSVGNGFIRNNKIIDRVEMDRLIKIEDEFLLSNKNLRSISLPNAEIIGSSFLYVNEDINDIDLEKVRVIKHYFLNNNKRLYRVNLPNVEIIGEEFISNNNSISKISMNKVKSVGDYFLNGNNKIKVLILPQLEEVGDFFLFSDSNLVSMTANKLKSVGSKFLFYNEIFVGGFPNLISVGDNFMFCNSYIYGSNFKSLRKIKKNFLPNNKNLKYKDFNLLTWLQVVKQRIEESEKHARRFK